MHQKLPHYLQIGKPIISIAPIPSAVSGIIDKTGTGINIDAEKDWYDVLFCFFNDFIKDSANFDRKSDEIEFYDWENISKLWLEILWIDLI